jgi:acyl dehydratase
MALREFSSVKVGDLLPEKVIPLTRADLVNYAGVSGDLNPIHWDDEIAKQVGLDTAIAHGMLTMGLGGGYVTSWVGCGHRVQRALHRCGAGSQRWRRRRNSVQWTCEIR